MLSLRTYALRLPMAEPKSIADLPSLGPKSQAMLAQVGIATVAQLRQLGSVRAFAIAKAHDPRTSLNLLWALESALCGLPWQEVARVHRASLLLALETLEASTEVASGGND